MKALRLHADSATATSSRQRSNNASQTFSNPRVQLEETPRPEPKANELLLRVRYCGLCGSDFHLAEAAPDKKLTYPGLATLPVTIGHEFSGEVIAHGPGSSEIVRKKFPISTLLTAEEMQWCGECSTCLAGNVNHCENLEEIGFTSDGAHAEFITVPAKYCWSLAKLEQKLGADRALQLGALVEPYAVSFRALFQGAHSGKWLPGNRVLMIGCGPIGLAAVDLALCAGAVEVQAIESVESRRKFAVELGVTQAFTPEDAAMIKGNFDWIVDAAGATKLAVEIAGKHLAVGGTLCLLARTDEPATLLPEALITRNARIVGSQGHSGESTFSRVIDLMASGRLKAEKIIREIITLPEAAERLSQQRKSEGKILVNPGKEAKC
ncbi:MAG: alcohol dehydrogenase catalytic domain-containing protein [Bdellovibrionota bacterium]